jgi:hypothetical protein
MLRMAKNKGILIDILRKTAIAENVERLRPIAKQETIVLKKEF